MNDDYCPDERTIEIEVDEWETVNDEGQTAWYTEIKFELVYVDGVPSEVAVLSARYGVESDDDVVLAPATAEQLAELEAEEGLAARLHEIEVDRATPCPW